MIDVGALGPWENSPLRPLVLALGAALVGYVIHHVIFFAACRWAARTRHSFDDSVVRQARDPIALLLPLFAARTALDPLPPEGLAGQLLERIVGLALIGGVAWLAIRMVAVASDVLAARYRIDVADNLTARTIRTQLEVIRRVVGAAIIFIALAAILMTFPNVRQLGTSLLASAGIASLVVGMAARPAFANLIAGLQLALTEPIRLDDVVIVEGEWGRIEEIGTSYVIVAIWDQRRLVVPLSYFIEKPFQNWTRRSSDLLGTVMLYADYTVPVEELRAALKEILESTPLWDRRVCVLQVTDLRTDTMELRALVSAAGSSQLWDLRCLVRERLNDVVQKRWPSSLPRVRAQVNAGDARPSGATNGGARARPA